MPVTLQLLFLVMIYSAVASVLPVWVLLQPRDYINSHQLIVGLSFLVLGLLVVHPDMVAPAYNPNPAGAPPLFPFIFVTIAKFGALTCSIIGLARKVTTLVITVVKIILRATATHLQSQPLAHPLLRLGLMGRTAEGHR